MAKDRMTFECGGTTYKMRLPYPDAEHAIVDGWTCGGCGGNAVQGSGRRIEGHAVYAADGGCMKCRKVVGVLKVHVAGTLFGLREDEAVKVVGVFKVHVAATLFGLREDEAVASMGVRVY